MMRRREFIAPSPRKRRHATLIKLFTIVAVLSTPIAVEAQQPKKIPRLCFLTFDPGTFQSRSARFEPFFNRLNELGYVDAQTITIDYRSAEGRNERFAEIATECLRFKADVIAVTTTPGALAAKQTTQTVPIVMLPLGDPVGVGLVSNIARPEGNITGTTAMTSELSPKRLELLKDAAPSMSRVLVLSYLVDPIAPLQVKTLEAAAPSLGVKLCALIRCNERQSGDVCARPRQAGHIARAQRIADRRHDDGDGAARFAGGLDRLGRIRDDHVDVCLNKLGGERGQPLGFGGGETTFECDILPLGPAPILQPLFQCAEATLPFRIVRGKALQQSDPPHALALLRTRRERPRRGRAAEKRDELATTAHSITSSARASSVGGTSRPSPLAVLRFMTSSNFVGA